MQIKNLQTVTVAKLTDAFNLAFSDYVIPLALTEKEMAAKIIAENINPELSAGVFYGKQLVGYVLIGTDNLNGETIAYNAGTGVIPKYRGQKLTRKMYDFLFPLLKEKGITSHQLEVISTNEKAIPIYQKIGFETKRIVSCFKGNITAPVKNAAIEIRSAYFPDPAKIESFCDIHPTFQNSWNTIMRAREQHLFLGAFAEGKLVGYLIFTDGSARVKQFAIADGFRRKGIAHGLFYEMHKRVGDKTVSLINVDDSYKTGIDFLKNIGLEMTVQQYEMVYKYNG